MHMHTHAHLCMHKHSHTCTQYGTTGCTHFMYKKETSSFEQWCGCSMQFYFQYFFSFYWCFLSPLNCTIELQLISLDFARFCNFFNVVTNRWTDGPMDRQTNGWMDQWMEQWMYNVSFVYKCDRRILKCWFFNRFCHFYKSVMDRQTGRPTDRRTTRPTNGQTNPLIEMR